MIFFFLPGKPSTSQPVGSVAAAYPTGMRVKNIVAATTLMPCVAVSHTVNPRSKTQKPMKGTCPEPGGSACCY